SSARTALRSAFMAASATGLGAAAETARQHPSAARHAERRRIFVDLRFDTHILLVRPVPAAALKFDTLKARVTGTIKKLTIKGFKSIRKLEEFELRPLNVLIGANGAGKSNFVSFFRLLREMIEQRLQIAVATTEGGADACLFLGPHVTGEFSGKVDFG